MAEKPTSSTIPVITISSHSQQQRNTHSSSSSISTLTNGQETPLPTEKSSTSQYPPEVTDEVYTSETSLSDDREYQTPVASSHSSPQATLPPRTQPGVPGSLRRKKQGKGSRITSETSANDTKPWHGVVLDPSLQKEQAVVFPSKMVYSPPNIPYNNKLWAFQRSTGYSDFVGSGFLFLQVNGEKERKNVKDNTYVFIVLEGAVEVIIHQTSYAVSTSGVFLVPRGNDYSVRNISEKEAKLFFVQARKTATNEERPVIPVGLDRPSSKSIILADWLLQKLVAWAIMFRAQAFTWYWKNLAKYKHHFTGRRLYFIFFLFGLIVRRLPFIGSPPILNIQLVRVR